MRTFDSYIYERMSFRIGMDVILLLDLVTLVDDQK